ncbi:hypothetical protein [Modestobacter roseus]|uniref:hypothetical protein n=1 Tax=Modestobacter roseus TaxID=1181884 RepID=UPI0034DE8FDF
MTATLPRPVELPDPPGSVTALGAVLDELGSAAFTAGLAVHLLRPAAVLTGWQGEDARVAAGEVAAALGVADGLHHALTVVSGRLREHHDRWLGALARLRALREDQEADVAQARAEFGRLLAAAHTGDETARGRAEALAARLVVAEGDRAAEHAALLADLERDAAEAAGVLAAAGQGVAGSGGSRSVTDVTVHLAGLLPGWGDGALTTMGVRAAAELTGPDAATDTRDAVLRWAEAVAVPAVAEAFVAALGADGLTFLLALLSEQAGTGEEAPLAGLLAAALTSAGAGAQPTPRVREVLSAVTLPLHDPDPRHDETAVGMGVVLAAPGAGAALVAAWGRHLLEREAVQGHRAVDRVPAGRPDPVAAALTAIVGAGDADAASRLLHTSLAWAGLLRRVHDDDGWTASALIALAGDATDTDHLARQALQALGQGLDPADAALGAPGRGSGPLGIGEPVHLEALGQLAGAIGMLVADRSELVRGDLAAAGTGEPLSPAQDTGLRGLGLLLTEPPAEQRLTSSLVGGLALGGEHRAETAGALVAVQEFGHRARYALRFAEEVVDTRAWTATYDLLTAPVDLVRKAKVGVPAGVVVDVGAVLLQADGRIRFEPDTGPVHTAEDAARLAAAVVTGAAGVRPSGVGTPAGRAAVQAGSAGFTRTSAVLTLPPLPARYTGSTAGAVLHDVVEGLVSDALGPPSERERRPRPTVGPR